MVPDMGLFSKKNIDKAKQLAEKNAAKIASGVDKATDAVDKKTGGKYTDKLKKVDEAAKKFAKEPTDSTGTPGDDPAPSAPSDTSPPSGSTG